MKMDIVRCAGNIILMQSTISTIVEEHAQQNCSKNTKKDIGPARSIILMQSTISTIVEEHAQTKTDEKT